jgi:asparagine synthase (glutamine-hydrolysing)
MSLGHRGPDGAIEILEDHVATGFCRLSIVDMANGMQPFHSEDMSISVTGNGEIYNYLELQEEVMTAGHILSTGCDMEVIPHLYEIYGDSFVHKLRGMFVVVLIDKKTSELKIYVDKLGEKPIYWSRKDQFFIYSSEIIPLLKSKLVEMILDTKQIPAYIKYGYTLDPYTVVKNVYRVSGGTFLTYSMKDNSVRQTKYWNFLDTSYSILNPVTELNLQIKNISKFIGQGEAKIGLALSGGIDSQILGKNMKNIYPDLESITIGYLEKSQHDESVNARNFANKIGMKNYFCEISNNDVSKIFREVCLALDEPIADISAIGYFQIFKEAKKRDIKVIVTGHGSDEIFFGYPWLIYAIRRAEVRARTLSGSFRFRDYLNLLPRLGIREIRHFKRAYEFTKITFGIFGQCFLDWLDVRKKITTVDFIDLSYIHRKRSCLAKKLNNGFSGLNDFERTFSISSKDSLTELARFQIIKDYLRINGFMQIDKLSMKCSVEARSPLADSKLVELAISSKWDPLKTPLKSQLRMNSVNYFDRHVDEYFKKGFSPPVRSWYKEIQKNLINELTNPRIIEMKLIPKKWKKYIRKPFKLNGTKSDIWFTLAVLEIWVREIEMLVGDKFITSSEHD